MTGSIGTQDYYPCSSVLARWRLTSILLCVILYIPPAVHTVGFRKFSDLRTITPIHLHSNEDNFKFALKLGLIFFPPNPTLMHML